MASTDNPSGFGGTATSMGNLVQDLKTFQSMTQDWKSAEDKRAEIETLASKLSGRLSELTRGDAASGSSPEVQNQLKGLAEDISNASAELLRADVEARAFKLERRVAELESVKGSSGAQSGEASSKVDQLMKKADALKAKVDSLEKPQDPEQLDSRAKSLANKITELENRVGTLSSADSTKAMPPESQSRVDDLAKQAKSITSRLNRLAELVSPGDAAAGTSAPSADMPEVQALEGKATDIAARLGKLEVVAKNAGLSSGSAPAATAARSIPEGAESDATKDNLVAKATELEKKMAEMEKRSKDAQGGALLAQADKFEKRLTTLEASAKPQQLDEKAKALGERLTRVEAAVAAVKQVGTSKMSPSSQPAPGALVEKVDEANRIAGDLSSRLDKLSPSQTAERGLTPAGASVPDQASVTQLQEKLTQATAFRGQLEQSAVQLQQRLEKLENAMKTSQKASPQEAPQVAPQGDPASMAKLQEQLDQAIGSKNQLEENAKQMQARLEKLEQSMPTSPQGSPPSAEAGQLKQLEAQNADLSRELDARQKQISDLQTQLAQQPSPTPAPRNVGPSNEEYDALKENMGKSQADAELLRKQVSDTTRQVSEHQSSSEYWQSEAAKAQQAADQAKKEADQQRAAAAGPGQALESAKVELRMQKEITASHIQASQAKDGEIQRLLEERQQIQTQLGEVTVNAQRTGAANDGVLKAKEDQLNSMQAKCKEQEATISTLKTHVSQLNEANQQTTKDVSNYLTQLEDKSKEIKHLRDQQAAAARITDARGSAAPDSARLRNLQTDFDNLKAQYEEDLRKWTQEKEQIVQNAESKVKFDNLLSSATVGTVTPVSTVPGPFGQSRYLQRPVSPSPVPTAVITTADRAESPTIIMPDQGIPVYYQDPAPTSLYYPDPAPTVTGLEPSVVIETVESRPMTMAQTAYSAVSSEGSPVQTQYAPVVETGAYPTRFAPVRQAKQLAVVAQELSLPSSQPGSIAVGAKGIQSLSQAQQLEPRVSLQPTVRWASENQGPAARARGIPTTYVSAKEGNSATTYVSVGGQRKATPQTQSAGGPPRRAVQPTAATRGRGFPQPFPAK